MKTKIIFACFASSFACAQIGINTSNPAASLDVVAKRTDGSTSEGIIAPRLTGDQIKSADARYTAPQTGAFVYAMNAVNGATSKTVNITAPGYYYFDGRIWQKMGQDISAFTGDIKHSARTADHGGWYLLNGRAISTLPVAAQAAAASLGFTGNIPNATNRVLKTKTAAENIGAVGGANTITIDRVNLPNVNFTGNVNGTTKAAGVHTHAISGTAMSAGAHSHTVSGNAATSGEHGHGPASGNGYLLGGTYVNNNGTGNYQGNGQIGSWGNIGIRATTASAGAHTHTVSGSAASGGAHGHNLNADAANAGSHAHVVTGTATVSTGGAGTALDNRSAFLVVNTYIYLGQ